MKSPISAEERIQAGERSVDRFAMAAGAIFGVWVARAVFGGSAIALGLGAVVGFFIVSGVAGQMARTTAGSIVGRVAFVSIIRTKRMWMSARESGELPRGNVLPKFC
jgi:hypothetical protein